jgi:hypothetical protein
MVFTRNPVSGDLGWEKDAPNDSPKSAMDRLQRIDDDWMTEALARAVRRMGGFDVSLAAEMA